MGHARILKKFMPLLLLSIVLVACSGPQVGGIFILKRTALGGQDINSLESTYEELKVFEEMGDPEDVEEYLEYEKIAALSVGTLVKVTGRNNEHDMVQIQDIDPKTRGNMKIWLLRDDLITALE